MAKAQQQKIALAVATVSALVSLVVTGILTADYVDARRRQPLFDRTEAQLQDEAQQDAARAVTLAEVQDRETTTTLERRSRTRLLAIVLMVALALFVTAAKWLAARRPEPAPALASIQAVKAPPGAARRSGRGRRPEAPTEVPTIDLGFVDEVVARVGTSPEAAIPILQAIQEHYRYLPDEALRRVCALTEITPAQIAGTSSFYAQFRRSPVGKHLVRICHGTACHVAGAREITDEIRRHLEIPADADTDSYRLFTVQNVACVGCCSLAPVLMVDEHTAGRLTPATAPDALWAAVEEEVA